MCQFSHLHVHTQFSLLDGAANISTLFKKAVDDKMPSIAITDHGNMFGVFKFVAEASKYNTAEKTVIKPIVGCELYVVENRFQKTFSKENKDKRYHQLLLAKNANGYKNLMKLCSAGYTEGLYSKYPRVDKELIEKYHEGLIATSCCLGAIIPKTILEKGEAAAEQELKWWLNIFGEDFYIEFQRHGIPEQEKVNTVLLHLALKYNIKIIASNDSHYVDKEDANAHDILLCLNTGEKQSTPKLKGGFDDDVMSKEGRFAFYNDEFYFKKTSEMKTLFKDVPQAIENTNEIVEKIEVLKLKQDILLPHYVVPKPFQSQEEYLEHITWEGAKQRYSTLNQEIEERIKFELFTIRTMGFAGYFLIVSDFIKEGRNLGVLIGPGRGSAAGSVVAYCTGITNIDPIKYNLLFERFLNPDRKSMPDIDTDFDDEGRQKVIDYVVDKYGKNQVAQIVTYGSMAARSSIKDVARVLDLHLSESNALVKLVPEKPGIELDRLINAPLNGENSLIEKEKLKTDELELVKKLREIATGNDLKAKVLKEAVILEGSVRNTGVHAAGIIIAPEDLTNIIPVATSKDSPLLLTQYDGKVIEDAGVIKMDFLGLKTLSIIKDAIRLIKENHNINIDIDNIPFDDKATFQLLQKAQTAAIFQFDAPHLISVFKEMKPTTLEDLIALNALNRPGPNQYIPNYIRRKHGLEKVEYDIEEMEEFLKETYGITVYQEQVMLLSQKLANFSKGDADFLRKAMGKKDRKTLDKMKSQFIEGCNNNGFDIKKAEKVWTDWEKFAEYAFNKSHSTCYSVVSYQTAYLKTHYPSEFMAANLANNTRFLDKIAVLMEECKRMNIKVLGPDVNESNLNFTVNKKGEIRFGLSAVKGVGEGPVESLINERLKVPFKSIFDITKRCNLRTVNKRVLEALAYSGALDSFEGIHRAQYFDEDGKENIIEKAIKFGNDFQNNTSLQSNSLFGGITGDNADIQDPIIPKKQEWSLIEKLKNEKEVIGMYLSGHPLDLYKLEIEYLTTCSLINADTFPQKELNLAGIITDVQQRIGKNGREFANFTLEDYDGSYKFTLFGDDYLKFRTFMLQGLCIFLKCKKVPSFRNPEELELKIIDIEPLDKSARNFKSISLQLNVDEINSISINSLKNIVLNHKGDKQFNVFIFDDKNEHYIKLFSTSLKVNINASLADELSGMQWKWKLN
jgi:DNA polymerase-3 subunit alpha